MPPHASLYRQCSSLFTGLSKLAALPSFSSDDRSIQSRINRIIICLLLLSQLVRVSFPEFILLLRNISTIIVEHHCRMRPIYSSSSLFFRSLSLVLMVTSVAPTASAISFRVLFSTFLRQDMYKTGGCKTHWKLACRNFCLHEIVHSFVAAGFVFSLIPA